MIVVDDLLLFETLAGSRPTFPAMGTDGLGSTFSWYYRLARAVATGRVEGSLSRRFAALTDDRRRRVLTYLDELPTTITILHARELVPVMRALSSLAHVNFLTAEAVASAIVLEAPIFVSTSSDLLSNAAARAHVEVVVLPTA